MPTMMLIVCVKRELDSLVEEFEDWRDDGMQAKLYGITEKAQDGFILLEWSTPIPDHFTSKLKRDEDILDVLTFDSLFHPVSA
ncbi:MAG TPA: hypothetical protein VEL31_02730 [Ktedonobacteraceae bacterium]|nr:hypothetical protein [Ktedonobacteraceae bacterium]